MPTCGIYVIEQTSTGKRYIGSSNGIERRWERHRSDLNCKRHPNHSLQRAWDKYGSAAFEFKVVEVYAEDELLDREQHWLNEERPFASGKNGFNLSEDASCPWPAGKKRPPRSAEHKAKISASKKGRKLAMTPEQIAARNAKAWSARRTNGTSLHSDETRSRLSEIRRSNPTKPSIEFEHEGSRMTLKQYAIRYGVSYAAAYWRLKHGKL